MTGTTEPRRYKVHDLLGRGGFGCVYRAELVGVGGFTKQVAIKVLNDDVAGQTSALTRLRDEARVLGRLRHRAIVQVDGLLKLDNRWAIVMEYIEGVSAKEILDVQGRFPISVALQIIEEVAAALHVAYAAPQQDGKPLRLLHRDIKPSNIQLTAAGEVKLLDFGVARAEFDARESQTQAVIYGSVPYMAPERMKLEDSHEADIFSLGVTLLELVSTRLAGPPSLEKEVHDSRVEQGMELLAQHVSHEGVEDLARAMLRQNASRRPDAAEVEKRCRQLVTELGGAHLRDWADDVLPELLRQRQTTLEELSGTTLTESIEDRTADGHGTLSGLLSAQATFDDPATMDVFDHDAESPAPEPPVSAVTAPVAPPRSSRRRGCLGLVLGLGASSVAMAIVAALLVATLACGGVGLVGAVIAEAWPQATVGFCTQAVSEMRRKLLDVKPNAARSRVDAALQGCLSVCSTRELTVWEIGTFSIDLDAFIADGELTNREATLLIQHLDEIMNNDVRL